MWKTKAINRELPPGAGKQRRQRREEGMAMLFLLPSLLGLVLLSLIPMLISLYISLTDWVVSYRITCNNGNQRTLINS